MAAVLLHAIINISAARAQALLLEVLIILPLKNYINTYFFFSLTSLYKVDAGRWFNQVLIEDKSLRCALPRI